MMDITTELYSKIMYDLNELAKPLQRNKHAEQLFTRIVENIDKLVDIRTETIKGPVNKKSN